MAKFGKLTVAGIAVFALLQCVRPGIPAGPATAEIQAPANVKQILDKGCYSCHSSQLRLAWFDQVVPVYWLVRHDILTARQHLNFSTLGSKPAAVQKATLYEAVNMIQLGAMPLPSFAKVHPEARITPEELAVIKAYLDPWTTVPDLVQRLSGAGNAEGHSTPAAAASARTSLSSVLPEFDSFPFDPDFENWKLISTTDRGDNNTFRFILGNEIAVRAAQSGNIFPWPDGTRFAKIAWQLERSPDGLIYPAKFYQVELMVKDARRYRSTDGWGWGRWRGLDPKPYGADAGFVQECTGCHMPMRGDDAVFTLPISRAHSDRDELVNNRAASLPASLPWQPLNWSAVTMLVDPANRTTATLYANEPAAHAVNPRVDSAEPPAYPKGAVLALVTWAQRDDPHWFGARIPDRPESVEFVEVGGDAKPGGYRRFDGSALAEDRPAPATAAGRMRFIINLPPAPMP
jgi:mono/diheme cytochrome c family protein